MIGSTPLTLCVIIFEARSNSVSVIPGVRYEELMLLRDDKDLSEFLQRYQVEESEIKREW